MAKTSTGSFHSKAETASTIKGHGVTMFSILSYNFHEHLEIGTPLSSHMIYSESKLYLELEATLSNKIGTKDINMKVFAFPYRFLFHPIAL